VRQNLHGGLRGQRLAGGGDALLRDHLRTAIVTALAEQRGRQEDQRNQKEPGKPGDGGHAG
jgi:hypothetical protein